MADPLEALAARARGEPFFLGYFLAAYARSESLDEAGLAVQLGCPQGELPLLHLCRSPRIEPEEFNADVGRIAGRFGINPQTLAEAVKRGRVVVRLQAASAAGQAPLMAARDPEETPPQPPESP
jgi:hypothetical protein